MQDHNNMTRFNTIHYNTSHPKALYKDSTNEPSIGWRWALTMRRIYKAIIHKIHILSLSICPFGAQNQHALSGLIISSSPHTSTHLLIPPNMKVSKMNTIHWTIAIISTHGRVPQLHVWAQLTPSPKCLFPPKGEWCFTPITQNTKHKTWKPSKIQRRVHTWLLTCNTQTKDLLPQNHIYNTPSSSRNEEHHIYSTCKMKNTMDHGYQPPSKQWKIEGCSRAPYPPPPNPSCL